MRRPAPPGHDAICAFLVRNERAINRGGLRVPQLALEMGGLKVGTVSVDETKIKANASIHASPRSDRAALLEAQLDLEVESLMAKARDAEANDPRERNERDTELQRTETLREKLLKVQATLEKRAEDSQESQTSDKKAPDATRSQR